MHRRQRFTFHHHVCYEIGISCIQYSNFFFEINSKPFVLVEKHRFRLIPIFFFNSFKLFQPCFVFSEVTPICQIIHLFFQYLSSKSIITVGVFMFFTSFLHSLKFVLFVLNFLQLFSQFFFSDFLRSKGLPPGTKTVFHIAQSI